MPETNLRPSEDSETVLRLPPWAALGVMTLLLYGGMWLVFEAMKPEPVPVMAKSAPSHQPQEHRQVLYKSYQEHMRAAHQLRQELLKLGCSPSPLLWDQDGELMCKVEGKP